MRNRTQMIMLPAASLVGSLAPVAQGIEHRPPEAGAQVRILPGAPKKPLVRNLETIAPRLRIAIFPTEFQQLPTTSSQSP